jgi:pimeloyl-ACP methyl ester carboxylesterase
VDVERGTMGRLPYFATGAGPPLVFLAGLSADTGFDSGMERRMNAGMVAPFSEGRRVVFFNRRPGLPRGMTMAEMAAEHADAIREGLGDEPVDVAGISTGGSIAQQLAADHPGVVGRLVLLSTACRLGPEGRELQRRVAARIRKGARRQAFAVMAAGLVPPRRGRLAAAAVAWLAAPQLADEEGLPDMATTIEAEDDFDLASCRSPVRAPTLILAGREDRFYSPELFEETSRLIPGSRLRVFDGRGHVTVTRHPDFPAEIRRFLQP